jgi:hypothetical protein
MNLVFDYRTSDSPLVGLMWRTQSAAPDSFISAAFSTMEMVVTRQKDGIHFSVLGPGTRASRAPIPEEADFFGITFKLGTFMPCLPANQLVDGGINLPTAVSRSFWLQGSAWEFPTFDNADTFVERLARQGLLAYEPMVESALKGQMKDVSLRSVQRRFQRVTGLTHGTVYQIERARRAMKLLQDGVSILDTVDQAGYYDQSHMTRSLKLLMDQTPAQITGIRNGE